MALDTTEVDSPPREPGRPVDRHWLLVAALVVALVVGGMAVAASRSPAANEPHPRERPRPARS